MRPVGSLSELRSSVEVIHLARVQNERGSTEQFLQVHTPDISKRTLNQTGWCSLIREIALHSNSLGTELIVMSKKHLGNGIAVPKQLR